MRALASSTSRIEGWTPTPGWNAIGANGDFPSLGRSVGTCRRWAFGAVPRGCRAVERANRAEAWFDSPEGLSAIRIATFAGAYARVRSSRPWRTRIFLFDVLFQIGPRARSGEDAREGLGGDGNQSDDGVQVPGEMSGAVKVSEARRPRRRGRRSRAWTAPWRNKTRPVTRWLERRGWERRPTRSRRTG